MTFFFFEFRPVVQEMPFKVSRALDHLILGPKFGPIPNAKKYVFSPIPDEKFPPSLLGPNKLQMYQLKNSIKTVGKYIKVC